MRTKGAVLQRERARCKQEKAARIEPEQKATQELKSALKTRKTAMITITLSNGSVKRFEAGVTPMEIARSISASLGRNVLAAVADGVQSELNTPLYSDTQLTFYTWDDDLGKKTFWHSSAHLLAQAILHYYPAARLSIGPAIAQGFYYDVDFGDAPFAASDFEKLEKKMLENARKKSEFKRYPVSKRDALAHYKDNPYKTELIKNLADGSITFCSHGDFTDLCRGGHIPHTGAIKAVKVLNAAGAYWRGDPNNPQLTRVYGISFPKLRQLQAYLTHRAEAQKRDHRKLGKEMGLFAFSERVGQGLPLWLPKGAALRKRLTDFLSHAQLRAGYEFVVSPHIGRKELYVTSGHYEKYGKDSFQPIRTPNGDEVFLLKPMNCPHHCEIYNTRPRSYRDLPKRFAEYGTVYRYEQSGELHGLIRARGFTQDDAHIFCTPDQLSAEFQDVIDLVCYVLRSLSFEKFTAQLSLRDKGNPQDYIGTEENWESAERAIVQAARDRELPFVVSQGEAAFYGPKLDFMVADALGREWQLSTIQVDYNLPERFDLTYVGKDDQLHRPVLIHRAPLGSLERFIAILIEHTAGDFPLWLHPEPVIVLPVSDVYRTYAEKVLHLLCDSAICGQVDDRSERIGKKIRDAERAKVPYMLIVGEKEAAAETVSVRRHKRGDLGVMDVGSFIGRIQAETRVKPFKN